MKMPRSVSAVLAAGALSLAAATVPAPAHAIPGWSSMGSGEVREGASLSGSFERGSIISVKELSDDLVLTGASRGWSSSTQLRDRTDSRRRAWARCTSSRGSRHQVAGLSFLMVMGLRGSGTKTSVIPTGSARTTPATSTFRRGSMLDSLLQPRSMWDLAPRAITRISTATARARR